MPDSTSPSPSATSSSATTIDLTTDFSAFDFSSSASFSLQAPAAAPSPAASPSNRALVPSPAALLPPARSSNTLEFAYAPRGTLARCRPALPTPHQLEISSLKEIHGELKWVHSVLGIDLDEEPLRRSLVSDEEQYAEFQAYMLQFQTAAATLAKRMELKRYAVELHQKRRVTLAYENSKQPPTKKSKASNKKSTPPKK